MSEKKSLPQAFAGGVIWVALDKLLPSRSFSKGIEAGRKYAKIKSSIAEIGLIEPVSVTLPDPKTGFYTVIDGHMRLQATRELLNPSIACLCARDDEGYTYNKRVNRLATVQEFYMIERAIERGVPEERLAKVLDIEIQHLRNKRNLLTGICPEVIELFKDKYFPGDIMRDFRRMKPTRQIECAELMIAVNNFSKNYASALYAATPADQLADPEKPKRVRGLGAAEIERMEQEMSHVQKRFKTIEGTYGNNVLNMVLARGYIAKLMKNKAVASYLQRHQPEYLQEFKSIVAATSLDEVV